MEPKHENLNTRPRWKCAGRCQLDYLTNFDTGICPCCGGALTLTTAHDEHDETVILREANSRIEQLRKFHAECTVSSAEVAGNTVVTLTHTPTGLARSAVGHGRRKESLSGEALCKLFVAYLRRTRQL